MWRLTRVSTTLALDAGGERRREPEAPGVRRQGTHQETTTGKGTPMHADSTCFGKVVFCG